MKGRTGMVLAWGQRRVLNCCCSGRSRAVSGWFRAAGWRSVDAACAVRGMHTDGFQGQQPLHHGGGFGLGGAVLLQQCRQLPGRGVRGHLCRAVLCAGGPVAAAQPGVVLAAPHSVQAAARLTTVSRPAKI